MSRWTIIGDFSRDSQAYSSAIKKLDLLIKAIVDLTEITTLMRSLKRSSWTKRITLLLIFLTLLCVIDIVRTAAATDTGVKNSEDQQSTLVSELLDKIGNKSEFLDAEDAFKLNIEIADNHILVASFSIAPGYYLYREKISFAAAPGSVQIASYDLPPGIKKQDEYFGNVEIYKGVVNILLPILRDKNTLGEVTATIVATYQGCAEDGICYPPSENTISIGIAPIVSVSSLETTAENDLTIQHLLRYITTALAAGFLLSFTPCVLPLIPILSSVIAGQNHSTTKSRTGTLSIAYVLGTATTYTGIGVIAGATGEQLNAYFQNIWAIGTVSFILTLMALSLFGMYTIQIPNSLQSRLSLHGNKLNRGTLGMVFVLGALMALVVGACVSPILISVLSIAILRGSPVLGGALMLSIAIGMGIVLVSVGFGAAFLLPKTRFWMKYVQHFFGFTLLGVAVYMLGTISWISNLMLWGVLFIMLAIYLAANSRSFVSRNMRFLGFLVATIVLAGGIFEIIGGLSKRTDVFRPVTMSSLKSLIDPNMPMQSQPSMSFIQIRDLNKLDSHMMSARNGGRPVLLDFYAAWCTDCIRMKKSTFSDPQVILSLKRFVALQVDVTNPNSVGPLDIKRRFKVFGPPAILFFNSDGIELKSHRVYGYKSADEIIALIKNI
ncbi:MAG: hypothetical protein CL398_07860 [Acidiferrobacteraceae bacterium]|nr:hypothetical protein [Acidiferrobacteraceae bacterium]